eukprot:1521-Heterococcus_DN1.PRE.2
MHDFRSCGHSAVYAIAVLTCTQAFLELWHCAGTRTAEQAQQEHTKTLKSAVACSLQSTSMMCSELAQQPRERQQQQQQQHAEALNS